MVTNPASLLKVNPKTSNHSVDLLEAEEVVEGAVEATKEDNLEYVVLYQSHKVALTRIALMSTLLDMYQEVVPHSSKTRTNNSSLSSSSLISVSSKREASSRISRKGVDRFANLGPDVETYRAASVHANILIINNKIAAKALKVTTNNQTVETAHRDTLPSRLLEQTRSHASFSNVAIVSK